MQPLSISKRNMLASLSSKKMRSKYGYFLVEGKKSVRDLVDYCGLKYEIQYLVSQLDDIGEAEEIARNYGALKSTLTSVDKVRSADDIPVYSVSAEEMRKVSSLASLPGIIAVCRLPEEEDEIKLYESPLPQDLYLMLDGVQDPGNLGTIIRTAHWFGIKKIFASKDTVDLYNPKVVQASMGSLGSVEVIYVDLVRLSVANPEMPLIGLLLDGFNLFTAPHIEKGFLIMGNEGKGLSSALRERIDISLTIPPYDDKNHCESLNVAIATAITLAYFRH